MHKDMLIKPLWIFLLVHIFSTNAISSGLAYIKLNSSYTSNYAKLYHRSLKKSSKIISFLNCPFELIERQWLGRKSVVKGAVFLDKILTESLKSRPIYNNIIKECESTLAMYKLENRSNFGAAREIGLEEKRKLFKKLEKLKIQNYDTVKRVINTSLNQSSSCYLKFLGIKGSLVTGLKSGITYINCITPLGRRMSFQGRTSQTFPANGRMKLSLPSPKRYVKSFDFKVSLYNRQEDAPWQLEDFVPINMHPNNIAWTTEQADLYNVGTLKKKDLSPLYFSLRNIINIGHLARTP